MRVLLTPAARLLGRELRLTYVLGALALGAALLFASHRIGSYLVADAERPLELRHVASLLALDAHVVELAARTADAGSSSGPESLEASVARFETTLSGALARATALCDNPDPLCENAKLLAARAEAFARAARALGGASPDGGAAARTALEAADAAYRLAADRWLDEYAARLRNRTLAERRAVENVAALLALGGLLSIAFFLEPLIRRLQRERAHLDLGASERRRLAAVAERTGHAVVITDAKGRIEWVNGGFERLTGYTAAFVAGRRPQDLLHGPDTDPMLARDLGIAIAEGRAFQTTLVHYASDRRAYWVEIDCQPLLADTGEFSGHTWLCSDCTAEHVAAIEMATLNRRLTAASAAGHVGLFEWRVGEPDLWLDETSARMLGLDAPGGRIALGVVEGLLHVDDRARFQRLRHLTGEAQTSFSLHVRTRDGANGPRHLAAVGLVERSGGRRGACLTGALIDETDSVVARNRLEAENSRAESALRSLKNHQYALDQHTLVTVTDAAGTITFANEAFCRHSGYSREELIGQTHSIVNSGTHPPAFFAQMWETIGNGKVWRGEVCNRRRDGTTYWVDCSIVPFRDWSGAITQYIGIRTDITQRRLAEEQLAARESLLRYTSKLARIGGWEYDPGADYPLWSDTMFEIHELPVGAAPSLDRSLEYFPIGAREALGDAITGAIREARAFDLVLPFTTARGRRRWVRMLGEPQFSDGHCRRVVGALQDVTETRDAAEELLRAKDAAEAASRAKGDFLANMSHEIRTPLNGILGMTGLLLESGLNPEQQEYAEIARSSGESLLALINNILDLSKIESGHLELESIDFDLRAIIEETIDAVSLPAARKGLELLVDVARDCPARLRGDPTRLRQILINLVGNAVKFTERGEVVVDVAVTRGAPGTMHLRFSIADSGAGIPHDKLERLFAPFVQADASTTRRHGGTGLGLSICKRLVEAMGGEIGATSTVGAGTTFLFDLTLEVPEQPPAAKPLARDLSVLIVDDHPRALAILCEELRVIGATATGVPSAIAAVEAFREAAGRGAAPRLVLIDHGLPDRNGAWVTGELRALDPRHQSTLVLMSPLAADEAPRHAPCYDRQVTKPIRRVSLARLVEEAARGFVAQRPADTGRGTPFAGRRALLVDDNAVNQKLGDRLLRQLGFSVLSAWNGVEALDALASERFDVVLMDCQMPEMDGYEATQRLRRGDLGVLDPRVPVIAMTANAMTGDRERCLASGMDDYLAKPVEARSLRATLSRVLVLEDEAQGAAPARSEPAAVVDWAALEEMVGGDADFLGELIATFLTSLPALSDRALAAAVLGDLPALKSTAHQLKGAALGMRAQALAALADRWQSLAGIPAPADIEAFKLSVAATREAFLERARASGASLPAAVAAGS